MRQKPGQSLIELIVALGMMSLLLVALLALVSLSVRNSRLAKNNNQALALAQSGVELMRAMRDFSFSGLSGSARIDAYDLPQNWQVEDGLSVDCDSDSYQINGVFSRCVTISSSLEAIDTVNVTVTVNWHWQEGGQVKTNQQISRLTRWER